MGARAREAHPTDSPARFALAYAAAAAFVLLVTTEPRPGLLIPVGIAALPFAAAPRQRLGYRLAAAAALLAYMAALGGGGWAFAPSAAALLLSGYRVYSGRERSSSSRRRR